MDGHGIERQSSIENEPRTLSIRQIEFAREEALYVVNTKSIEEALSNFTEGLEPVVRCDDRLMGGEESQTYCNDERTRIPGIRDIVSAPF